MMAAAGHRWRFFLLMVAAAAGHSGIATVLIPARMTLQGRTPN